MRAHIALLIGSVFTVAAAQQACAQGLGSIGSSYGVPEAAAMPPEQAVPQPRAQMSMQTGSLSAPAEGAPVAYNDPKRKYTIIAPAGARFQHRGEDKPLAIQSRKGYAVNIQVGNANPSLSISNMFAKLESQYLGDGKSWATKLHSSELVVGGLPAGSASYESGSTRTRVVIARGRANDFVFMFFAPVSQFEVLSTEFNWILQHFHPDQSDMPTEPVKMSKQEAAPAPAPVRAETAPQVIPAGRPTPPQPQAPSDVQVFAEPGYGYRIEYPLAWHLEKVSAFTNIFSGEKGSPAYDAIVALQNVQPAGANSADEAASAAFADIKASLQRDAKGVAFVGEKAVSYVKYGLNLEGRQFVANYDHNGRQFRKWVLVLPRPDGNVAHVWSYTAPIESFESFRPVAERILQSLKIDGAQGVQG